MDKGDLLFSMLRSIWPPDDPEHKDDASAHRHRWWRRVYSFVAASAAVAILSGGGWGYVALARAADVKRTVDEKVEPLLRSVTDLREDLGEMRRQRDEERKDALEVQIVETHVRCLSSESTEIRTLLRSQIAKARADYRRLNRGEPYPDLPVCPDR